MMPGSLTEALVRELMADRSREAECERIARVVAAQKRRRGRGRRWLCLVNRVRLGVHAGEARPRNFRGEPA